MNFDDLSDDMIGKIISYLEGHSRNFSQTNKRNNLLVKETKKNLNIYLKKDIDFSFDFVTDEEKQMNTIKKEIKVRQWIDKYYTLTVEEDKLIFNDITRNFKIIKNISKNVNIFILFNIQLIIDSYFDKTFIYLIDNNELYQFKLFGKLTKIYINCIGAIFFITDTDIIYHTVLYSNKIYNSFNINKNLYRIGDHEIVLINNNIIWKYQDLYQSIYIDNYHNIVKELKEKKLSEENRQLIIEKLEKLIKFKSKFCVKNSKDIK